MVVLKKSGWKTLGYAMGENWESKFGVDLNSDKSIGNHDSNADGLVDNRSAPAYDQGRSISLKTAQRKVLSAKSSGCGILMRQRRLAMVIRRY